MRSGAKLVVLQASLVFKNVKYSSHQSRGESASASERREHFPYAFGKVTFTYSRFHLSVVLLLACKGPVVPPRVFGLLGVHGFHARMCV
jgi:hypothetical protein